VEDYKASLKTSAAAGASVLNPSGPLVVSNLPNHANAFSSTLTLSSNAATSVTKKPTAPLKNPFPDAHLPFLVGKISELQVASFVVLVETIYQELKAHKVKKVAIEAKIREVGEKCKEKKVWIVKPAFKVGYAQQIMTIFARLRPVTTRCNFVNQQNLILSYRLDVKIVTFIVPFYHSLIIYYFCQLD
jgi:hypothetical protein